MKESFTLEQQFLLLHALNASYKKGDDWYWDFINRFLEAYENQDEEQLRLLEKESYTW